MFISRYLPPLPPTSEFLELNVRTYVKFRDKSGVFFFSLDAANPLAVEVARVWYLLPYFHAQMAKRENAAVIEYSSGRTDWRGWRKPLLMCRTAQLAYHLLPPPDLWSPG